MWAMAVKNDMDAMPAKNADVASTVFPFSPVSF